MKRIQKFNDLINLLQEDGVAYSASPWHKDMQTREHKPTSMSIADLMQSGGQHPNDPSSRAGNVLPEPMLSYMHDLGDLWLKVDNLEIKLTQVSENPLISDSPEHRRGLKEVIAKLKRIKAAVKDIGTSFDNLLD